MSQFFLAIIETWITEFDIQAVRDILLEFLSIIAFLFLFVVVIIAMTKSPILNKHGSIEMLSFVILGFIFSVMNVFDEFAWFTETAYNYWKLSKDLVLLIGALLLIVGFFRFFMFSSRLFGKDFPTTEDEPLEDKFVDQM